jgi:DNA-binding XRE family transcriptional regulator
VSSAQSFVPLLEQPTHDKYLRVKIYRYDSSVARPGRKKRAESRYAEQAERLAARLRALREQRGMTQEQLAAQAQISVATVRNIERVVVIEPCLFTVLAMARVLDATIDDVAR